MFFFTKNTINIYICHIAVHISIIIRAFYDLMRDFSARDFSLSRAEIFYLSYL